MPSKLRYLIVLVLCLSGTPGPDRAVDTDVPANIAYLGIINVTVMGDTSQDAPPTIGSIGAGGWVLPDVNIALVDGPAEDGPAELTSSPRASGFPAVSGSGANEVVASAGAAQAAMGPAHGSSPGGNNYSTGGGYQPSTQQDGDIVNSNSSGTQTAQGVSATAQATGSQVAGFTTRAAPVLHPPGGTISPLQVSNTPPGTNNPLQVSNPPGGTTHPSQVSNPGTRAPDDSLARDTVGKGTDKADQVTGHSGHGDAADKAPGSTGSPASLPCDTTSDGAYVFCVDVIANETVFLDPIVAIGYDYAIGNGDPFFATVTLPIGIGDSLYTLGIGGDTFSLAGGELFDFRLNGFPNGVAEFEVLGIETGAMLDPSEPAAFVTEVTFTGAGQFTGTMTPIIAQVPEPATLALFGVGLLGLGLSLRRKSN